MWGKKKELEPKKYRLGPKESVSRPDNVVQEMHRVIAVRDIPRYGVSAGEVGGYVETDFNLCQDGDAWIGGNACVSGRVKVRDNALVTGNALVISNTALSDPYNWIGGVAMVRDNAKITGKDFLVSDSAKILNSADVFSTKVSGNAVISGQAKVILSGVSDSVRIDGESEVRKSHFKGNAVIKENAYLLDSIVSGTSVVGGKSRIENAKIRDNTHISGNVKVKENTVCEGDNILSGDLVIPPNYYVVNKIITGDNTSFMGVLGSGSISSELDKFTQDNKVEVNSPAPVEESDFVALVEGIETEYKSYSTDIVKLIKYPLMADPSVPETQEFLFLLRKAKRLFNSKDKAAQQDIAEKLERAFMVTEAKALKVSSSVYSDEERKKTEDAKVFIAKACDAGSTIAEKKISFRSTMRALEGIVPLPEAAVDAYRERVGLLEIEA